MRAWVRKSVTLILVTAVVVPLGACGGGEDPEAARMREDRMRSELMTEIQKAQKDVERAEKSLQSAQGDIRTLRGEVGTLAARVAELEARPAGAGTAPADAAAASPAKSGTKDRQALIDEMKGLQTKVFDGTATDEEQQRFWELARTAAVVDEFVKAFEAKVKDHPDDVDAKMQLASAYIAKLMSIPPGPEQGLWSAKAEQQWQAVLKKDPENWDARYSVAFNWSMWPDFLNKTPDAVKEFETLRQVQERQIPVAKHAQTYLQLARLYQKQNKGDKAKETLSAGLARHPDDAELRKALDALE